MIQNLTDAQIQLTAVVLHAQLHRLIQGCSGTNPLQTYEFQLGYPEDTYDWLISLGLLPQTLSQGASSFPGRGVQASSFAQTSKEIAQLPLTDLDYQIAVTALFRDRLFWRDGLRFYPAEMTPDPAAKPLFDLLASCGWLVRKRDVWHWSAAATPHLGPVPAPPPSEPPPQHLALYQSMPATLKLYFQGLALMKGPAALAKAIQRHRRNGQWHIKANGSCALDPEDISQLTLARLIVHLGAKPNPRHRKQGRRLE